MKLKENTCSNDLPNKALNRIVALSGYSRLALRYVIINNNKGDIL